MSDPAPNADLLRSLGRLARGLSALFWGLPLALFLCVQTAKTDWLRDLNIFPPLAATGLVLYGLWQLGHFQKQERPWRSALDRAKLLALILFGLSPFLYWWNHIPTNPFSLRRRRRAGAVGIAVPAQSELGFAAARTQCCPTKRCATKPDSSALSIACSCSRLSQGRPSFWSRSILTVAAGSGELSGPAGEGHSLVGYLSDSIALAAFVLLPLAMTMALIWKTKEVILDSVFRAK